MVEVIDIEYGYTRHSRRHRQAPTLRTCDECEIEYDPADAGHEKLWMGDTVYEFYYLCPSCGYRNLWAISKAHAYLRLVVQK